MVHNLCWTLRVLCRLTRGAFAARLQYEVLRDVVRRRAKQAGVNTLTLHSFGRGFAITMLRNGADLVSLSRMMGHGSLPVLTRHLKQTKEDLGDGHAQLSPADTLR
jgi:site-specific recombinase XerD